MPDVKVTVVTPRVVNGVAYADFVRLEEKSVVECDVVTEGVAVQELRAIVLRPDSQIPDTPPKESKKARLDELKSRPDENRFYWRFDDHHGQDSRLEVSEEVSNLVVIYYKISDEFRRGPSIGMEPLCSPAFSHEVKKPITGEAMIVDRSKNVIEIQGQVKVGSPLIARIRVHITTDANAPSSNSPGWDSTVFPTKQSSYSHSVSVAANQTCYLWVEACDYPTGAKWKPASPNGIQFKTA